METAAAKAPDAPAISTVLLSLVVAATPSTRPKIETVPSSMPKTISPALAAKDCFSLFAIEDVFKPPISAQKAAALSAAEAES